MTHGVQLQLWLKLLFGGLGGFGLLLSTCVDSSFIPLPLVSDVLLMELSSRHPVRMPYYAVMATLGSLGGCIWIYWLARKGGEAYYRKTRGRAPGRVRRLIEEHPVAAVFLPAVAPFPVPFKPFVIAQGVFQVPFGIFIVGTLLGRACLFFFEGFLGARYGAAAKDFLISQKWASLGIVLILVVVALTIRLLPIFKRAVQPQSN
ncbi:MAG TPA: VTT domain-containing protein [Candidatus Acidoferrum sp.]|nr:VTT domain-containing protein [Candidatus Acidoferrum sp.]